MARTRSTKAEAKQLSLEDLQEIVGRNQDQLQDLASQMNATQMRLDDLLDELGEMRGTSVWQGRTLAERTAPETEREVEPSREVINITRRDGVYTLKFKSFNFFRWLGVLTVGAVIGIFIMGIFG